MGNRKDPRYKDGVFKAHTPSALERVTATLNDPTCYGWTQGPVNDLGYPTWQKGEYTLFFFPGWAETPAGWYRDCGNGQVTWYETTVIAQVNAYLFSSYTVEQEIDMSMSTSNPNGNGISGITRPAGLTRQCEEYQVGEQDGERILVRCPYGATHRVTLIDGHDSPYQKKLCLIHQVKLHQEIEAGCSLVTILDEKELGEPR